MGSEKAGDGLGLPSALWQPWEFLKTPSHPIQTGSLRVWNNDGEHEGKWSPGSLQRAMGSSSLSSGPSCTHVPQVSCPLARALLSTHCFRIPPRSLSPRISAPHPTAPNRLPRLLCRGCPHTRPGSHISLMYGGAQRQWDEWGSTLPPPLPSGPGRALTRRPRSRT